MRHRSGVDVTVVVVDSDDHPLSPATFDAVRDDHGELEVDVVLVDARATPGRVWLGEDQIRVVRSARDASETEWRLAALEVSDAPVVAFLDASAVPTGGWLSASLHLLHADPVLGAVSGASQAIGEPTLSFTGKVGPRHPLDDRAVHTVLYPIPEAAVLRRSAMEEVGGLAAPATWSAAVVDLGWRLTLAGRLVALTPEAIVSGRCTCVHDDFHALGTLHSCLGDNALALVLPAAMIVAAQAPYGPSPGEAIDRFVAGAAALADRRERIQAKRVVDDCEIFDLFVTALEPARGEEEAAHVHEDAARRHGLGSLLPTRHRILVVTPDIFRSRMAGPAIRAWQIAEALSRRHEVQLVSTASVGELTSTRFEVSAPEDRILRQIADRADVILIQGFAMEGRPYLARDDKVLIVDIYDPLHLEQLELFRDATPAHRRVTLFGANQVLNEQLVRGDFLVCASAKQRDFWLGQLAALGRVNHVTYDDDNRLTRLLEIVPFGLPDEPPRRTAPAMKGVVPGIGPDDHVILWGGGIYNWFDPLTLIRAIDRLRHRWPRVRLFFLGLRHPNPDVREMRVATEARLLAKELGLTNRFVFFNEEWVPYEDRQNYLLEADIGISTHLDHVETEFSFRTRILDYIWAALPIIATDGDWFADLIRGHGLGIVVPPLDAEALEQAMFTLLSDRDRAASCRGALEQVRGDFTWSEVLRPLVAFCRHPRRAPDLVDPEMRASLWSSDSERRARWLSEQPGTVERLRRMLLS